MSASYVLIDKIRLELNIVLSYLPVATPALLHALIDHEPDPRASLSCLLYVHHMAIQQFSAQDLCTPQNGNTICASVEQRRLAASTNQRSTV